MAVFSALKNRDKKKAVAKKSAVKKKPVKKAPAKKVVAKKAPAKKAPTKKIAPKKIELKKDLTAKDVQAIVAIVDLLEVIEVKKYDAKVGVKGLVPLEFHFDRLEQESLVVDPGHGIHVGGVTQVSVVKRLELASRQELEVGGAHADQVFLGERHGLARLAGLAVDFGPVGGVLVNEDDGVSLFDQGSVLA